MANKGAGKPGQVDGKGFRGCWANVPRDFPKGAGGILDLEEESRYPKYNLMVLSLVRKNA